MTITAGAKWLDAHVVTHVELTAPAWQLNNGPGKFVPQDDRIANVGMTTKVGMHVGSTHTDPIHPDQRVFCIAGWGFRFPNSKLLWFFQYDL